MKKVLIMFTALMILSLGTSITSAQYPNFEFHFEDWGEAVPSCPGVGVLDTGYVFCNNYNMWVTAIEYEIEFPPEMVFILDQAMGNGPSLTVGDSDIGMAVAWQLPQACFPEFRAVRVLFEWNCVGCPSTDIPVVVHKYPSSVHPGPAATQWNTIPPLEIPGLGMTSLICPTVPTEATTWGQVKALYD